MDVQIINTNTLKTLKKGGVCFGTYTNKTNRFNGLLTCREPEVIKTSL